MDRSVHQRQILGGLVEKIGPGNPHLYQELGITEQDLIPVSEDITIHVQCVYDSEIRGIKIDKFELSYGIDSNLCMMSADPAIRNGNVS